ncbi:glycosyltransferase [uncultured Gemmiger sp.]|uniref:glycosyltransferase family 2 protein n=1 Tax=uncultured Gemmiger sp. TaxID=1623490 RepID=UPI0025F3ADE7|nr:glycosyltransferase [uncultured Gemmiger sp.]
MSPLISVVVPVYNSAPYLETCLRSLLAQTWQDWEAILVDDGSTDGSARLCDTWAKKEPRLRVIHQKNAGVSAARNAGIAAARGEYLAFVDADDWVEPDYLQTLFNCIGSHDMAVCCVWDLSDWNEKVCGETVSLQVLRTTPSRYANPVFINYACNKLYRTALVRPAIRFPEGVRRCEDAYFAQDCLLACRSIAVCPDKLYHYEQHEGSALHRFYTGVCRDELPLMERQHTLFHPAALPAEEERAYRVWEYGKVLAVCRYIRQYAPDRATRKAYLQRWVTAPAVWHALRALPPCLGRKATVLNLLTGLRLRRLCIAFLEYLCQ